ncbi:MDR family MFS transporter [Streptantibioticus silvisoli]|uniref:MDR family MFS transporter n=1 Tax=Streptantibioticus silvisoli TaxID=2705255 RepID=A0ABT6WAK4_9ACTN|nr:MDR family MFS transporter [Streptantibioticus silvisoli]MDI5967326.1 MDR family MFS transporter [Streptantibioticus silvisoli]
MGVTTLGAVMSSLDTTIVTVGVDAMARSLRSSVSVIQWVTTGYLLAFSAVIPLTGWVVDRLGVRRAWLLALTVFLVGSVLSGIAWSAGSLIAFRTLQGLGGGMLLPLAQTVLAREAEPRLLGRVMGLAAIPGMLSPVFGPVIGGVIVDHLSWPWLFFVNVPIGVVAITLAVKVLPGADRGRPVPLDVVSLLLLSPGVAAVVFGFSQAGGARGFGAPAAVWALVAGAVLLAAFTWHSLRRGDSALVNVRLFAGRGFTASAITATLLGAALFGALILFPLYYQLVRGQGAMTAGLLLAPQGVGAVLVARYAGKLTDRLGAGKVVLGGLVLAVAGTVPYAFVGRSTPEWWLVLALLVRGLGLGFTFMPTLVAAYQGIPRHAVPQVTTVVNIAQRVGGSLGTALLITLLQREYAQRAGHAAVLGGGGSRPSLTDLVPAFDHAFWWAAGFSALALLPALLLPRKPAAAAGQ